MITTINEFKKYAIKEAYNSFSIDDIKKHKKLSEYTNYTDKKIIDEITYLHFPSIDDEWFLWGTIMAFDNNDGTEVGNATYGKQYTGSTMKGSIDVRPDMRRNKIGSTMYEFIEEVTGETLYPDLPHSTSASMLWNNKNRKFGSKNN